jgi:hypothetical protein
MIRYLLIFLLLCLPAWATTYYLNNAATGANNGSTEANGWQSWATMMTAINALDDNGSGDTVVVSAGSGTYGDCTDTTQDARTDWLTIQAKTGEVPVLASLNISCAYGSHLDKYLKVVGLKFYESPLVYNNFGISITRPHHIYIEDCVFLTPGSTVTENSPRTLINDAIRAYSVGDLTIHGCTFESEGLLGWQNTVSSKPMSTQTG